MTPDLSPTPDHVRGFADALLLALDLSERHVEAHAATALDRDGRILDLVPFGPGHTIDSALDWAWCLVGNDPRIDALLLVSVRDDVEPRQLRERDVATFHAARRTFADVGVEVLDWVLTDGHDLRSMAISCLADDSWGANRAAGDPQSQ